MKKEKIGNIAKIVLNVIVYVFLVVCILVVFLTAFSKKDSDGTTEIFGTQIRIVTSESMAKCDHTDTSKFEIKDIPLRSMVFIQVMPKNPDKHAEWYRSLKPGDVLTFRYVYTTQVTITHRIKKISEPEPGRFIIELQGDNTSSKDGQLIQTIDTAIPNNPNYVIGKVTGQSKLLGAVISFLRQPIAIILIIILPCLIIIALEVIKIVRIATSEKREKAIEEARKQQEEIDSLKKQISELQRLTENKIKEGESKEE